MDKTLKEAKRLYALGYALHWLKPKSKAPIELKWSSGKRKSWEELRASYRPGFNMGVRLGQPSRFKDGTYLAVIDCDVKSTKREHRKEMELKLKKLIDAVRVYCPEVMSGRGNGSRHLHIRTDNPLAPFRYTQSKDKVRVRMPSVRISQNDRNSLSAEELTKGYRIRPAWEISIMGQGQQVVLPPSIHPDSKKPYVWSVDLDRVKSIPHRTIKSPNEPTEKQETGVEDFTIEEVDLMEDDRLPSKVVDMIAGGHGVTDRSASCFTATIHMLKAGFNDNEIMSVLTDMDNYLGQTAYDHANTGSRQKAAKWIARFTLAKAKKDLDLASVFQESAVVEELDEESALKQREKLFGAEAEAASDWKTQLERTGGHEHSPPKPIFKNIQLILQKEASPSVFKHNAFAHLYHYSEDTPWGGESGKELKEIDLIHMKAWLAEEYRMECNVGLVWEVVQHMSHLNQYHPVRDYLDDLVWDGVERLDGWLGTYLGATGPKRYIRDVGRKTLCAMVARVLQPGCKYDNVLVLEGPQGCGKSTAVRLLSDPWFSDAMINIGDKDAVLSLRSAWCLELGELSSMRKADIDQLKQFISQATDRIRVPYGRITEAFPRQSIFIGTTNSSEYLKDTTGNRRFWPVRVSQCKFKDLKRDRDQLLAEARIAWESMGEPLYLEDLKSEGLALIEQGERVFEDEWGGELATFFSKDHENFDSESFSVSDLFRDFGPFAGETNNRANQMRAAQALRDAGFEKYRKRGDGSRRWFWKRSEF